MRNLKQQYINIENKFLMVKLFTDGSYTIIGDDDEIVTDEILWDMNDDFEVKGFEKHV